MDSDKFRLYKKLDIIASINDSGLLEHLYNNLMPQSIVLFVSASKGEDTKESDMDIFVQCKETDIDLNIFEKR